MDVEIRYSPSFALGVITLPPGGEVKAEAGTMTSMTGGVEIETNAQGGMFAGLKRSVLGGESFFINTFRAPSGGELTVAPTLPGDIVHMPVGNSTATMVQSGSWLASDMDVKVDTKWGGGRTFFSGEGLFLLRCTGPGDMSRSGPRSRSGKTSSRIQGPPPARSHTSVGHAAVAAV